jgi:hypothetical protein
MQHMVTADTVTDNIINLADLTLTVHGGARERSPHVQDWMTGMQQPRPLLEIQATVDEINNKNYKMLKTPT